MPAAQLCYEPTLAKVKDDWQNPSRQTSPQDAWLSGWCASPEPGPCYCLGRCKSQRMEADDCMSGAGWEAWPGGGGVAREKGRRVETWLVLHRQISSFFQTGKSCLGCAHLQRVTVFTTLPGSTDFFLSFSQTQLVFFIARAEQTVGALPPRCVQKHIMSDSKGPARLGSRGGWGSMLWRQRPVFTQTLSAPWRCTATLLIFPAHIFLSNRNNKLLYQKLIATFACASRLSMLMGKWAKRRGG